MSSSPGRRDRRRGGHGRREVGDGEVGATGDAASVFELQSIADLVAGRQQSIEVVLGMRGRDAEASAGRDERCGRVADDDDGDLTTKHLVREGGHLGGMIEQQGDDGRVVVAVDDEAESPETQPQIAGVEGESL